MKGDRYTTFGKLPIRSVFRYVPDHGRIGPRIKVDDHLICTPEFYRSHGCNPSQVALNKEAWKVGGGVHYGEENTRVRITLADSDLFNQKENP